MHLLNEPQKQLTNCFKSKINSRTRTMKIKDIITLTFVLILVAVIGYLWISPSGLQAAPQLSLKYVDGKQTQLADYKGRPVLVTFWATSCPGCIEEMPHLIELYEELAPKGLEIIGIAMPYDRPDHVMEMRRRKNINYPIVVDVEGKAVQAFGNVALTPTSFLIGPDGKIISHKIGEMDMELLHARIITLLNKRAS